MKKLQHQIVPMDDEYLNEFHKKWNEACMRENERTQSLPCSHEYLKAQAQRLEALWRAEEKARKN